MVYTIIRKRHVFHALANLPSDYHGISKCLNSRKGIRTQSRVVPPPAEERSERTTPSPEGEEESSDGDNKSEIVENSMEGSKPAQPAEPGTLKVSLLDTPGSGQDILPIENGIDSNRLSFYRYWSDDRKRISSFK